LILVDTSVLLDITNDDPRYADWSETQVTAAIAAGTPLFVNDVIYAELSVGFPRRDLVDSAIAILGATRQTMPEDALFAAGKAFRRYRRQPGDPSVRKTGVLPDFLIGAHAATEGLRLLTRDPRRVRAFFPEVDLITPD
jgi:predicted nucleic acid-binding protein